LPRLERLFALHAFHFSIRLTSSSSWSKGNFLQAAS
jgi:hypothetical protein